MFSLGLVLNLKKDIIEKRKDALPGDIECAVDEGDHKEVPSKIRI
jgi:hypothetical protein